MVLPGMGSHSPLVQSRSLGWVISSALSCESATFTMSVTGAGKCVFAISLTFLAMDWKICQSVLASHTGGTASLNGWMNECMSVLFRSAFSYHDAVGSTMSEYSAEVSMRKLMSTTRSILPLGDFSRYLMSVTYSPATSLAMSLWCVPR